MHVLQIGPEVLECAGRIRGADQRWRQPIAAAWVFVAGVISGGCRRME